MRLLICTTGTSVATGVGPFHGDGDAEAFRERIRARVRSLDDPQRPDDLLRAVSAESNSLRAHGVTADDDVVFLHTDTEDGRVCAEVVAEILRAKRAVAPRLRRVPGLQVLDATAFRRRGVQALFAELDALRAAAPDAEVVLNITGGFKSVVPYVTLYGVVHLLAVHYIFERSDQLLRLPQVPLQYDYERLGRASEALRRLRAEGALDRADFFAAIPGLQFHERDLYESLLEEEGDLVTLSAFGQIVTAAAEQGAAEVFVAPGAQRAYDRSEGVVREQLTMLLVRVAEPLWRGAKRHAFSGTELAVYKPGNTAERLACAVRGTRVYVCELFAQHDDYQETLRGKRAADYDFSRFRPWSRPSNVPPPPSTDEQLVVALRASVSAAEALLERAGAETRAAISLAEALRRDLTSVALERDASRAAEAALRADVASAQEEVASLRSERESAQTRVAQAQGEREDARATVEALRTELHAGSVRNADPHGRVSILVVDRRDP